MAPTDGKKEHRQLCHADVAPAGLPHREDIILKRERNLFSSRVDQLMGRGKGESEKRAESVPMKSLEDALAGRDATVLPAAAFLAGRCKPDAPEGPQKLTALLRDLLDSLPADNLDIMAGAYIEAAMSLALRGDQEVARQALTPLVTDGSSATSEAYLAAFYLAQLGDPSGYPAMVRALHSKSEHTRLMAARHLIAFKPYEGQTVGDRRVDVRAELAERLKDPSLYVRR
ncbi:MAG: hypothetical protein JOZ41_08580, partial [Chloroflexi bacterium]|nr:hypothetical protein [Chloroflexota bacterium]